MKELTRACRQRPRRRTGGPGRTISAVRRAPTILFQVAGNADQGGAPARPMWRRPCADRRDLPARRRPGATRRCRPRRRQTAARPAASAPRRRADPEPRRLPRARRLRGLCRGASSSAPEGVLREVLASKLVGRGGAAFPAGRKWEAVARAVAAALPRLQRRRVGARHVQGSRPDGRGSVRAHRGDDDCRPAPPGASAATSTFAASIRWRPRASGDAVERGARARVFSATTVLGRGPPLRHRAAARRRRLHLRRGNRALQLDRRIPRRAAQQAAVPGRRPVSSASRRSSTTSRRCERARHRPGRGPGLRGDRHGGVDRIQALLPVGLRGAPRRLRGAVRHDAARVHRPGRRRAGGGRAPGRAARRRRRHVREPEELDMPLTFEGTRAARRHRSGPASSWSSTTRSTCATSCCASRRSSATSRAASACPAASARCGRRKRRDACSAGRPLRARRAGESRCIDEIAQVMRDASICGLGQTAASACSPPCRSSESSRAWTAGGAVPRGRCHPARRRARRSTARPSACPRARRSWRPAARRGSTRRRSATWRR